MWDTDHRHYASDVDGVAEVDHRHYSTESEVEGLGDDQRRTRDRLRDLEDEIAGLKREIAELRGDLRRPEDVEPS